MSDGSTDVHGNAHFTACTCYLQLTDIEEFLFFQPVTNKTGKNFSLKKKKEEKGGRLVPLTSLLAHQQCWRHAKAFCVTVKEVNLQIKIFLCILHLENLASGLLIEKLL